MPSDEQVIGKLHQARLAELRTAILQTKAFLARVPHMGLNTESQPQREEDTLVHQGERLAVLEAEVAYILSDSSYVAVELQETEEALKAAEEKVRAASLEVAELTDRLKALRRP